MGILPFVSFLKEILPGSTSHRLEALSLPFRLRPFPNTDPIAFTPTAALPPRPATAADSLLFSSDLSSRSRYNCLRIGHG
jgi:hypothetical protein